MVKPPQSLRTRTTQNAAIQPLKGLSGSWRLQIPAGHAGVYRLAQLDDYTALPRRRLPWNPPLRLQLQARVSSSSLPGTWGFGLWNDPFSLSLGLGGMSRRFPALPQAIWFFYASPPNYLSFRDDLPAQGLLAATFASARLPTGLLAAGSLVLPFAWLPPVGRLLRRIVPRFVRQAGVQMNLDPVDWHAYEMEWGEAEAVFRLDGRLVYSTRVLPASPLGLVLWIDNQYAAWTPDGRLRFGFLAYEEPAWLEITGFELD